MKSSAEPYCAASDSASVSGRIFNIQRFSLHDGPGIRTVVFLKGCPLRCAWCANPEGISRDINVVFNRRARQGDIAAPVSAGAAPSACPLAPETSATGLLRRIGEVRTVDEIHRFVMADEMYYRTSGGGMTLSGGEMAEQPAFARALLAACRRDGVHGAVETSGYARWSALWHACELSSLVLYDLKLADPMLHLRYTGVSLRPIVRNLRRLLDAGMKVRLRVPVIPQVNDSRRQAEQIMQLIYRIDRDYGKISGIDLLPYHSFGMGKYALMGLPYRYAEMHPDAGPPDIDTLMSAARRYGLSAAPLSHCIA